MSNKKTFSHPLVETANIGHLGSWSSELKAVLKLVQSSHVLLILDDFFLRKDVNQAKIDHCFKKLVNYKGNLMRLIPRPGPDKRLHGEKLIGIIEKGAPYRTSTQSSIWEKSVLESLLLDGETIWEFEFLGSRRSDALDGFFGVWDPVMPYGHHVVERGVWFRNEARRFARMDVGCDFTQRPILTQKQQLLYRLGKISSLPFNSIPWKWRRRLRWLRVFYGNKPNVSS